MGNQTTTTPDPLLSASAVAKWTGLDVTTLARKRQNGDGPPFVKMGKHQQSAVRYRRSAVEAWIAAQERRSTSDTSEAESAA